MLRSFFVILLSICTVRAADHYINSNATGNNDGSSWTDAYTGVPSSMIRGDTYYIAGGHYGTWSLDEGTGTGTVILKKALPADHGTGNGWDVSFGESPAVWDGIVIGVSDVLLDGRTGGGPGSWNTGFGFEITRTTSKCGDNGSLLSFPVKVSTITVRHVHMYAGSTDYPLNGVKGTAGIKDVTFSYNAIHSIFGVHYHMGNWENVTVEYSLMADNRSTGAGDPYCEYWHSESISSIGTNRNITLRYNLWDRIRGTAVIAGVNTGRSVGWKIYGNVFSRSVTTIYYYYDESGSNRQVCDSLAFYNNTVAGIPGVSQGGLVIQQGSGNTAYNNIWYNNTANAFGISGSHDYNFFSENNRVEGCDPYCDKDAAAAIGESAADIDGPNPFNDWDGTSDPAAADLSLAAPTAAGLVLDDEFSSDMYGNERGADGTWDRGAVEYAVNGIQRPMTNSVSSYSIAICCKLVTMAEAEKLDGVLLGLDGIPRKTGAGVFLLRTETRLWRIVMLP